MVVCLFEKKNKDFLISQSNKNLQKNYLYRNIQEQNFYKNWYFHCQQYGHKASKCNKLFVYSNSSFSDDSHCHCQKQQVCCFNYEKNHSVNSFWYLIYSSTRYLTPFFTQHDITYLNNISSKPKSKEY